MGTEFVLYGSEHFSNFQHFMDENMCLLGQYISKNLQCKIIIPNIPSYYNSTLKDILDTLGLHDRVELVDYEVQPVMSEPMWGITENKILFYRKLKDSLPNYENGPEKIFIKRTWGKGSGGHSTPIRRVVNEDDVQRFLESKGFVTVTFDGLSFSEKKKLLQNAKEIVTQTGANCINLFLCEKLEKMILLTNDKFGMGVYFTSLWQSIHNRGLKCVEIVSESINRHLLVEPRGKPNGEDNGNFYVEIFRLEHVIGDVGSLSGFSVNFYTSREPLLYHPFTMSASRSLTHPS